MIVLSAPVGLAAIAIARTAALHRRIRTTGSTGVTRRQQWSFWLAVTSLFAAAGLAAGSLESSRPMSAHVLEFALVALVGVPALMTSLPEWWVRQRLARWRSYRLARRLASPWLGVPTANLMIIATHLPWVVGRLPSGPAGAAVLVGVWVAGGTLLWLPALSPVPEHRLAGSWGASTHLFVAAGLAPLIAGGLLASGRAPLLGIDTTAGADVRALADQHLAGALMHLLVVPLVWGAIVVTWAMTCRTARADSSSRRAHPSVASAPARVRRRVDPTH